MVACNLSIATHSFPQPTRRHDDYDNCCSFNKNRTLRQHRWSFLLLVLLLSFSATTALQGLKPSSRSSSSSSSSSIVNNNNNNRNNNINSPFSLDPTKLNKLLVNILENPFAAKPLPYGSPQLEKQLLTAIRESSSTRDDEATIEGLIEALESTRSIPEPAIAPQIYGRWRLQYTTTKATSSPIQRTATTRTKSLPIFQDIVVVDDDSDDTTTDKPQKMRSNQRRRLLVKQVIQFSDSTYLTVDALASTKAYPLEELTLQTPRQSTGKVLGLNVLGVSKVGAEAAEDPNRPNARINFVFDEGYLDVNNGTVRIPYPVPFRWPLFRDWVKGWIDVTYLSETMRIARGNKGSTFVLVKVIEEQPASPPMSPPQQLKR